MSRVRIVIGLLLIVALGGCGSGTTPPVRTVTKTATVVRSDTSLPPAVTATTPRAKTSHALTRVAAKFTACDVNIDAKAETTTCAFAQNTFYEYYVSVRATHLRVYSPAAKRYFTTRCTAGVSRVLCRASDGGVVRFSITALDDYSSDQATAYAGSHNTGPVQGKPARQDNLGSSSPDYSSPNSSSGTYDSPDYGSGSDPGDSPGFCDTHDCIPNYPNGRGSTVQCADGTYSHSGGIQGACSHHGGVG